MRQRPIKFTVGTPTHRAAVWQVWVGGPGQKDVYINNRGAKGFKVSLHASGHWRMGFTREHMDGPNPLIDADRDRAVLKWLRPKMIAPGITQALDILIPSEMIVTRRDTASEPAELQCLCPPANGHETQFSVVMTEPTVNVSDWPGANTGTKFVGKLPFSDGGWLWVIALNVTMPDDLRASVGARLDEALSGPEVQQVPREQLRGWFVMKKDDGTGWVLDAAMMEQPSTLDVSD